MSISRYYLDSEVAEKWHQAYLANSDLNFLYLDNTSRLYNPKGVRESFESLGIAFLKLPRKLRQPFSKNADNDSRIWHEITLLDEILDDLDEDEVIHRDEWKPFLKEHYPGYDPKPEEWHPSQWIRHIQPRAVILARKIRLLACLSNPDGRLVHQSLDAFHFLIETCWNTKYGILHSIRLTELLEYAAYSKQIRNALQKGRMNVIDLAESVDFENISWSIFSRIVDSWDEKHAKNPSTEEKKILTKVTEILALFEPSQSTEIGIDAPDIVIDIQRLIHSLNRVGWVTNPTLKLRLVKNVMSKTEFIEHYSNKHLAAFISASSLHQLISSPDITKFVFMKNEKIDKHGYISNAVSPEIEFSLLTEKLNSFPIIEYIKMLKTLKGIIKNDDLVYITSCLEDYFDNPSSNKFICSITPVIEKILREECVDAAAIYNTKAQRYHPRILANNIEGIFANLDRTVYATPQINLLERILTRGSFENSGIFEINLRNKVAHGEILNPESWQNGAVLFALLLALFPHLQ